MTDEYCDICEQFNAYLRYDFSAEVKNFHKDVSEWKIYLCDNCHKYVERHYISNIIQIEQEARHIFEYDFMEDKEKYAQANCNRVNAWMYIVNQVKIDKYKCNENIRKFQYGICIVAGVIITAAICYKF